MKSPKLKILLLVAVWCASSGVAYWVGLNHNAANNKVAATSRAKPLTDHGVSITLNSANLTVPSTKDLMQTKGRPDADALKAWADSLDPAECPGVLDELQKMADGQPRDAMMAAMIASWAARDPSAYLQDYSKITDPRVRETGVGDALKALATKDPKAAIAFMSDSTEAVPAQMLAQRYRNAIQGMAANDPATALAFVQNLDPNAPANAQIQRQGLTAVADAMASTGNFTDALEMFSTLPDAEKTTASAELMNQWAQLDPADATKYVATLTDPTQQSTAAAQVARNWARDDPAAAAAWAASVDSAASDSTGQPTGAALAAAMRSWSRYDLDGSAAFLNTLTPSPQTDQAVATFAAQARNVDSATALSLERPNHRPGHARQGHRLRRHSHAGQRRHRRFAGGDCLQPDFSRPGAMARHAADGQPAGPQPHGPPDGRQFYDQHQPPRALGQRPRRGGASAARQITAAVRDGCGQIFISDFPAGRFL